MKTYTLFCAIYDVLNEVWEKHQDDEALTQLVSDMDPYIWEGEYSADPAVLTEFEEFLAGRKLTEENSLHIAREYVYSLKIPRATKKFKSISGPEWTEIIENKKMNGDDMRNRENLPELLELNYISILKKTHMGKQELYPELICNIPVYPDFLALYSEKGLYHATSKTGVCFYEFDNEFDGPNGLFQAIYYHNEKRLSYFKERFEGVTFIITPDYSISGAMPFIEKQYRIFRSRLVGLWFSLEMNIPVIPGISYTSENDFQTMLDGLERCSVVAFSTKGFITNQSELPLFKQAVKYTVDHLPLKAIIVYDTCADDQKVHELFQYAEEKQIQVVIPPNILKNRHREREMINKLQEKQNTIS